MGKLSREEVDHVADLARLYVAESEYEKYETQLFDILSEIDKIKEVDVEGETDIMMSPSFNKDCMRSDIAGPSLKEEEIFKNVKNRSGDYIVAVRTIND